MGFLLLSLTRERWRWRTIGPGRLSEPERIVAAALEILQNSPSEALQDMAGEQLLLTVVRPARRWEKPSASCQTILRDGWGTRLLRPRRNAAPRYYYRRSYHKLPHLAGVKLIQVNSAEEMHRAVMEDISKRLSS